MNILAEKLEELEEAVEYCSDELTYNEGYIEECEGAIEETNEELQSLIEQVAEYKETLKELKSERIALESARNVEKQELIEAKQELKEFKTAHPDVKVDDEPMDNEEVVEKSIKINKSSELIENIRNTLRGIANDKKVEYIESLQLNPVFTTKILEAINPYVSVESHLSAGYIATLLV